MENQLIKSKHQLLLLQYVTTLQQGPDNGVPHGGFLVTWKAGSNSMEGGGGGLVLSGTVASAFARLLSTDILMLIFHATVFDDFHY